MTGHQEGEADTDPSAVLSVVRGRVLLLALFLAMVLPFFIIGIIWPEYYEPEVPPLPDAAVSTMIYVFLTGLVWTACRKAGVHREISLGSSPKAAQVWTFGLLGIPMVCLSIACAYAVYLPLSYVWPEFVELWILDTTPLIWWEPGIEPVLASVMNAVVLVIVAPIAEEIFFRGLLLNRWRQKFGVTKAIVFSSLIFGLLHVDIIGGFIFGAVLSLVYLQTKSLVGPIVIHMSNNAIALGLLLIEGVLYGGERVWTLEEFRAYWWLAPLGALTGIPWIIWFCKKRLYQSTITVP